MSKLITKNDLKAIFDEIFPYDPKIVIGDTQSVSNVSVSANGNAEVSFTVTKPTGYTLVGALIQSNGNSYAPILSIRSVDNSSSTVSLMAYNLGSSAITRTISIRPVFKLQ